MPDGSALSPARHEARVAACQMKVEAAEERLREAKSQLRMAKRHAKAAEREIRRSEKRAGQARVKAYRFWVIDRAIETAAELYGVRPRDIKHLAELVEARRFASWLAITCGARAIEVGRALGQNHCTPGQARYLVLGQLYRGVGPWSSLVEVAK